MGKESSNAGACAYSLYSSSSVQNDTHTQHVCQTHKAAAQVSLFKEQMSCTILLRGLSYFAQLQPFCLL